tara:strand:+ start:256 stop:687 length:432 start_codon:yes stop_codon:yes gene_type:complete
MAISKTPTTKATITVTSNDMSSSPINLNCSWTMYKEASRSVGLDITSGLNRVNLGTTTIALIADQSEYDDDEAHMMYVKNLSTTAGEHLLISVTNASAQLSVLGRVQPGAACLFPWAGNSDINVTQGVASMEWEYQIFMQKED